MLLETNSYVRQKGKELRYKLETLFTLVPLRHEAQHKKRQPHETSRSAAGICEGKSTADD